MSQAMSNGNLTMANSWAFITGRNEFTVAHLYWLLLLTTTRQEVYLPIKASNDFYEKLMTEINKLTCKHVISGTLSVSVMDSLLVVCHSVNYINLSAVRQVMVEFSNPSIQCSLHI